MVNLIVAKQGGWSPPWVDAALRFGPLLLAALVGAGGAGALRAGAATTRSSTTRRAAVAGAGRAGSGARRADRPAVPSAGPPSAGVLARRARVVADRAGAARELAPWQHPARCCSPARCGGRRRLLAAAARPAAALHR
jgi:hypothetical protein